MLSKNAYREKKQRIFYEMGLKVAKVSEVERELGVIMQKGAKPSRQCAEASEELRS